MGFPLYLFSSLLLLFKFSLIFEILIMCCVDHLEFILFELCFLNLDVFPSPGKGSFLPLTLSFLLLGPL